MDMAEQLDEITYHLLASADDEDEARKRIAVVAYWAQQQQARLDAGEAPRVDHASVVAEALARNTRPTVKLDRRAPGR